MKKLFVLFMSTMIVVHTTIDMNIATVGAATIASSTEQLQSVDGTEQLPVQSENESQIFLSETDVELYHIGMNTTKQLESIVVGLDSNIVFTSDNEAVAKVSPYGFITAVKPGTATITATVSGASATCKVTVKDTSIKFEKSKLTMYSKGTNTVQLITIVAGESKSVTYKSNRTSVATVDKNGKVTARKAGTVIITATANGISADCEITVKAPTLTVDKKSATLYTHGTKTLKLKASTTGASKTITYKSSKPSVATIDKYGKITAVKPGTATITISANGLSTTCKITVKESLEVAQTSITVKKGKTSTIKAIANPSGNITFTSSNKKIATVDSKGKVKGIKVGKAKITVKANGVTKTVNVTVK